MGPLIIVLVGALATFWWLGLLTPKRLRLIGGIGLGLVGLFLAARNPLLGIPVVALGGYLGWTATRKSRADAMSIADAAAILGVRTTATTDEIRRAHRLAIASAHPDKGGTDSASAELNTARDILLARQKTKTPGSNS